MWLLSAKSDCFFGRFAFNGTVSRLTLVFGSSDVYNDRLRGNACFFTDLMFDGLFCTKVGAPSTGLHLVGLFRM